MSITALQNATDNLKSIEVPQAPAANQSHLSSVNAAKIASRDVVTPKVVDRASLLEVPPEPKLEQVKAHHEPINARLAHSPAVEARKARASGDEIEADDGAEKGSNVENEHWEEVSGGRRVDPVIGLIEEA